MINGNVENTFTDPHTAWQLQQTGIYKPAQRRIQENYLENVSVQGNPVMLFAAIGEASTKFLPLGKNAAGQKGHQKFKYAPLHEVVASIKPALAEQKVSFMQLFHTMGDKQAISLIVSGHEAYVVSTFLFDMEKDPQEFGKISTYYRRYQLQAFFCLEGDKDLDEGDIQGDFVKTKANAVVNQIHVDSNTRQEVAPKKDPAKTEPKKVVEEPKQETKSESKNESKPSTDTRSIGQKLMDAKKQLGWEMKDFSTFCENHSDHFPGFVSAEKLNAEGKQKLFDLLVKEKGVAPF
jgi:hypothetical protein